MTQGGFPTALRDFAPLLLSGVAMTIALTVCALLMSTILGFVWAAMRISQLRVLRTTAFGLITVIRGIPIIVQLFYVYFVLPDIGIRLNAFLSGVVGLGVAYSVYQAENFRAGLESVDPGLIEAVESLGMSNATVMRRVRLPLAVRVALPPFGNTAIMLLKDSSIASTITVAELTRAGQILAVSTFRNMEVYTLVALLYLGMSLPLTLTTTWIERRCKQP
jgi:polar amino acid transport system permease protein